VPTAWAASTATSATHEKERHRLTMDSMGRATDGLRIDGDDGDNEDDDRQPFKIVVVVVESWRDK
jgi:hypothetical protein